jgi:PAS domain S-box-containing protein
LNVRATASLAVDFLTGGGEMGARMRRHDWSNSPLGAPSEWPQSLRTAVSIMLNSRHPMFLAWGPELGFLYNDAYIPIFGAKHPHALGQPFAGIWAEVWPHICSLVERALNGEATWSEDLHLVMQRNGYPEDTWYTFSYSPIRDESGGIGGMFCACNETTSKVLAEQRLTFQLQLSEHLRDLVDPDEVTATATRVIGERLNVGRVGYGESHDSEQLVTIRPDWVSRGMPSLAGLSRPLEAFGPRIMAELRAGKTLSLGDLGADRLSADYIDVYAAVDARAAVIVPLIKEGRFRAVLFVHDREPRRWSDAEVMLVQDAAQRTWSAFERARAIHERHLAEAALSRQFADETERLRQLFAQAPSFMAVLRGPEHAFELVNDEFERVVGHREFLGHPLRTAIPEIQGQGILDLLDEVYATGRPFHAVERPITLRRSPDAPDEDLFVDFVYQPLTGPDGTVSGIFLIGHDATERRHTHDALRDSEGRLRLALQAARLAQATIYFHPWRITHCSRFAQMLGYDADHQLSVDEVRSRYHPDDVDRLQRHREDLLRGEQSFYDIEHRIVWPDGTVHWISARGEIMRSESGTPISVTAVYLDITDQRRVQAALLQSETEFRTFAQAMPNHVWVTDTAGKIEWFNDKFYEFAGREANLSIAERWRRVIHPDDLPRALERWAVAVANGSPYESELRIKNQDQDYRWFIVRALPIHNDRGEVTRWIGSNTDIDMQKLSAAELSELNATLETRVEERSRELRAAEDALRHSQKMEAVGQLTGGIAHDFNNLLTGIIGSLDVVRRRLSSNRLDDVERFMDAALTSANRAAGLTHRLLAFSRRQSLDAKPVEINRLIQAMEDLLRRSLSENIQLEMRFDPELWLAEADSNQLESALLNLALNARDAMANGGRLIVETKNTHLVRTIGSDDGFESGDYVLMRVSDTGVGMTQEVLERAFDPFFTTKPIGQGTGLGLSMIYGFAKQSRGHVRIESELGRGTTVDLYLPRFRGEVVYEEEAAAPHAPRAHAGESVMIVEDDMAVRMLVVDVLEEMGYECIEAADGNEAVPVLQSDQRIDLLITDVGLPGINGRQLAELARRVRPDLKVLFITGYAESAVVRSGFLEHGMEMVTKPFALDALASKIRAMLLQDK